MQFFFFLLKFLNRFCSLEKFNLHDIYRLLQFYFFFLCFGQILSLSVGISKFFSLLLENVVNCFQSVVKLSYGWFQRSKLDIKILFLNEFAYLLEVLQPYDNVLNIQFDGHNIALHVLQCWEKSQNATVKSLVSILNKRCDCTAHFLLIELIRLRYFLFFQPIQCHRVAFIIDIRLENLIQLHSINGFFEVLLQIVAILLLLCNLAVKVTSIRHYLIVWSCQFIWLSCLVILWCIISILRLSLCACVASRVDLILIYLWFFAVGCIMISFNRRQVIFGPIFV